MMRWILTAMALFYATSVAAQDIAIQKAFVPLAPPGAMSHAAYLDLTNTSAQTRSLIGVSAQGYGMAHLHESKHQGGVAVMSMVHQLDIAPGQTVSFRPGSLHIMLLHPDGPKAKGDTVVLTLHFSNGDNATAEAVSKTKDNGSSKGSCPRLGLHRC